MSKEAYTCTLDERSLKKAERELLEDEKERTSAVETLRKWIQEQPHLSIPEEYDTVFLLRFLRSNHFSQLESRKMLTKYINMTKNEMPEWFKNIDTSDRLLEELCDTGYLLMLPKRDNEGRRVSLERPGLLDPKKHNLNQLMRCSIAVIESYLWDEQTQVNGMIWLSDCSGYSMKHEGLFTLSDIKKVFSIFQGKLAGRFKGFHLYNMGPLIEAMMTFGKPFLPKKLQDRFITHSTMESVYKHIPMECLPVEYLPDDYTGPNAGTLNDCIEYTKKEFLRHREEILLYSSDRMFIDMAKAPADVPNASFRKLNVD